MTPRDRRALGLGAAAILAAFLGLRGIPRAREALDDARSRRAAQREFVLRGRAALGRLVELEDSTRILSARVAELAPRLLGAETRSEATAELAAVLGSLALRHRVRLDRSDPVGDSALAGGLGRVSLDAVLESDVRGLTGLLGALASRTQVTEITRLRVTAPDPSIGGAGPEVLRVEMRVRSWFLARGTS